MELSEDKTHDHQEEVEAASDDAASDKVPLTSDVFLGPSTSLATVSSRKALFPTSRAFKLNWNVFQTDLRVATFQFNFACAVVQMRNFFRHSFA